MSQTMLLRCFLFSYIVGISAGSKILFTNSSTNSLNGSPDLIIRCSLQKTTGKTPTIKGDKGLIQSYANVAYIVSIIINKMNDDQSQTYIAGISAYKAVDSTKSVYQVQGNVASHSGLEIGYLQVEWRKDVLNQTGNYRCQIDSFYLDGSDVKFTAPLSVGKSLFSSETAPQQNTTSPTGSTSDDKIQSKTEILSSDILNLNSLLNIQKAAQEALGQEVQNLSAKLNDLERAQKGLQTPHVETGIVDCGPSNNWAAKEYREFHKAITFSRPYSRPPVVIHYIRRLDLDNTANLRIIIQEVNVTSTGFTLQCSTWSNTLIWDSAVNWASFPS